LLAVPLLAAGLRALREPDPDAVPFDAVLLDAGPFDAELLAAERLEPELVEAALFDGARLLAALLVDRPPPLALRLTLARGLLATVVTDEASFSRSFTTDRLVFFASLRSVFSAAATSLYAVRALLPRSLRIVCNAEVASSSAFSKRAIAFSTSLRVIGGEDDFAARARRAGGFFAGGMLVLLLINVRGKFGG
jgi:hypothetical protein